MTAITHLADTRFSGSGCWVFNFLDEGLALATFALRFAGVIGGGGSSASTFGWHLVGAIGGCHLAE